MTVYEAIKIDGSYYIQALSICFKPIVCFGYKYETRKEAVDVACAFTGFAPYKRHERKAYRDYLKEYKARILKENNGKMPNRV